MAETYPELVATVLDAENARELAGFYAELLGYGYQPGDEPPPAGDDDPKATDWIVLRDRAGQPRLAIQYVDELSRSTWPEPAVPQQLHLDLRVGSVDELRRQHDRAIGLGATVLEDRTDDPVESIIVFADPAGHPFCILVGPG